MSMVFTNWAIFEAAYRREIQVFAHEAHSHYNKGDADRLAARMAELVHVDSGETKDAIGVTEAEVDGGKAWLVGTDPDKVDNAKALSEEFGTSKMSAIPFARPAMAEAEAG